MSKKTSFKDIEVKHDVCRGKDSVKKICESFRQHLLNRQTNKQKELLTNKQNWKKNKKEATNSINKTDKCHQYGITEAIINHKQIKTNPERITKIKALVTKYKFEGINYTSEKVD